jgi:Fe-S oxidoreductase
MSPVSVITVLLWLSMAGLAFALAKRAAYWREGRATAAGAYGWANLLSIPKRYFVDLHHVVARDPYIAKTHVATAGGAILAMALVFVNYGLAIYSPWLDKLIFLAALVMLVGAVFVWRRRHGAKAVPARLSRGPWDHLPLLLGSFALGLVLFVALPASAMSGALAIIVALLIAVGAFTMTFGAARGGPMKHALAVFCIWLFIRARSAFAERNDTDVVPPTALKAPLLDAKEYGVGKPVEFRWNQLLSFDACVQCGKCEAACPAFAAGQPLNPKKLIQDLVTGMVGGTDAEYAGSPTPGIPVGKHGWRAGQKPLDFQPHRSGHAVVVHDLSRLRAGVPDADRARRRDRGHAPQSDAGRRHACRAKARSRSRICARPAARTATTSARVTTGPSICRCRSRSRGVRVDVLLIAGEGAFDMRYQRTLRALVKVLNRAGIDYAVLGGVETDTGDTARRLGDEATFQQLAQKLIGTLSQYSFRKIVTADPHVLHSLRNEYRALGGFYEVQHHTALIDATGRERQADAARRRRLTRIARSRITIRAIWAATTVKRKRRAVC